MSYMEFLRIVFFGMATILFVIWIIDMTVKL
jgi:hypothetical protein